MPSEAATCDGSVTLKGMGGWSIGYVQGKRKGVRETKPKSRFASGLVQQTFTTVLLVPLPRALQSLVTAAPHIEIPGKYRPPSTRCLAWRMSLVRSPDARVISGWDAFMQRVVSGLVWFWIGVRGGDVGIANGAIGYKDDARHSEMLVVARVCQHARSGDQLLLNVPSWTARKPIRRTLLPLNCLDRPAMITSATAQPPPHSPAPADPVLIEGVYRQLLEIMRPS